MKSIPLRIKIDFFFNFVKVKLWIKPRIPKIQKFVFRFLGLDLKPPNLKLELGFEGFQIFFKHYLAWIPASIQTIGALRPAFLISMTLISRLSNVFPIDLVLINLLSVNDEVISESIFSFQLILIEPTKSLSLNFST